MHIIYSKHIKGSSSAGSGPYMMAKAKTWYEKTPVLTQTAVDFTEEYYRENKIDDPKNLKDAPYFQI